MRALMACFLLLMPLAAEADDDAFHLAISNSVAAYGPYMKCVADRARELANGPDTASEVATAAVTYCGDLRSISVELAREVATTYNASAPTRQGIPLSWIDDSDGKVSAKARDIGTQAAVEARAKRATSTSH